MNFRFGHCVHCVYVQWSRMFWSNVIHECGIVLCFQSLRARASIGNRLFRFHCLALLMVIHWPLSRYSGGQQETGPVTSSCYIPFPPLVHRRCWPFILRYSNDGAGKSELAFVCVCFAIMLFTTWWWRRRRWSSVYVYSLASFPVVESAFAASRDQQTLASVVVGSLDGSSCFLFVRRVPFMFLFCLWSWPSIDASEWLVGYTCSGEWVNCAGLHQAMIPLVSWLDGWMALHQSMRWHVDAAIGYLFNESLINEQMANRLVLDGEWIACSSALVFVFVIDLFKTCLWTCHLLILYGFSQQTERRNWNHVIFLPICLRLIIVESPFWTSTPRSSSCYLPPIIQSPKAIVYLFILPYHWRSLLSRGYLRTQPPRTTDLGEGEKGRTTNQKKFALNCRENKLVCCVAIEQQRRRRQRQQQSHQCHHVNTNLAKFERNWSTVTATPVLAIWSRKHFLKRLLLPSNSQPAKRKTKKTKFMLLIMIVFNLPQPPPINHWNTRKNSAWRNLLWSTFHFVTPDSLYLLL